MVELSRLWIPTKDERILGVGFYNSFSKRGVSFYYTTDPTLAGICDDSTQRSTCKKVQELNVKKYK